MSGNRLQKSSLWRRACILVGIVGMLAAVTLIVSAAFTNTVLAAQTTSPVFFTECAAGTGNNATVLVPEDGPEIAIGGDQVLLQPGDEVAAFRPVSGSCDTIQPSLCVGVIVWQGTNDAVAVWGDNDQTPEIDGIQVGEEICWRHWDMELDIESSATVTYSVDPTGNGTYLPNGIYQIASSPPTAIQHLNIQIGKVEVPQSVAAAFALLLGVTLFVMKRRTLK